MTIECYYSACPSHSYNTDPTDGPFCYERECLRTPMELEFLAAHRMAIAAIEGHVAQKDKLRAENETLKQERNKWRHRAKVLWEGYRLTEQMNMPEIACWFRGEGEK